MQNVQDLVTLVPWTFIATIINLFIQIYFIKKFLFKPVNDILEKRRQLADQEIRDAREAKASADAAKAEYDESLAKAHAEAARIVQDAQKQAQARAEAVVREAEQQAVDIKARAEQDIAQERKKAINEVKNEIGGLAMDIAGKVVEKEIHEDDHKKLIDEFIKNVGEAS